MVRRHSPLRAAVASLRFQVFPYAALWTTEPDNPYFRWFVRDKQ